MSMLRSNFFPADAQSLRRTSLAKAVEDQLLQRLLEGHYKPGDRLPSEVELGESLGVSRSVVREALKRLERVGVIRTVHGSGGGSFVQDLDTNVLTEQLYLFLQLKGVTIAHLMEARMILAPPMAALAAQRATDEDIEELKGIWSARSEAAGGNETGELIEAFHIKLAAMTRNPALEAAARPLIQLVTMAFTPAASRRGLEGEPSIMALQWGVLEAVRKRDGDLANERMLGLMQTAYARLQTMESDFSRSIRPNAATDEALADG